MAVMKLRAVKIRRILREKKKSQNWLAIRLSISKGYLSQLMNGTKHASQEVRGRFLLALETPAASDLFVEEGGRQVK